MRRGVYARCCCHNHVVSLDILKSAAHTAALMTEKKVGSVIVIKNDRLFGIVKPSISTNS